MKFLTDSSYAIYHKIDVNIVFYCISIYIFIRLVNIYSSSQIIQNKSIKKIGMYEKYKLLEWIDETKLKWGIGTVVFLFINVYICYFFIL
jgi:hypothetical protein